jgi:hypothetical protein
VDRLPEAGKAAASGWIVAAKLRVDAERIVRQITDTTLSGVERKQS